MHSSQDGSVAERFNATVLKTVEGLYPSVSSNLTASAKQLIKALNISGL